jgi:class 3 adenylate cyclase
MPTLPSGTVTFLFTDIEGSTELLKQLGDRYPQLLAEHRHILRRCFREHGGQEIDTQGDAFFYAFQRARAAVAAAVDAQRALFHHEWPDGVRVRVRIGLHTGEPVIGEEGYAGLDVVRAARIGAIAAGEQVLISETTSALVGADLPDDVDIQEVGRRRLKGIDRPEPIYALLISDLPAPAPPEGSSAEAKLSSEAAERARQTIERRVLTELERAVADAEAGKSLGWSDTVRWVLVTIIIVLGIVVVAVTALGVLYGARPDG